MMVPVIESVAYYPLIFKLLVRAALGAILFFKYGHWLKGHWNVPAIQLTDWSQNNDWNVTEINLSRNHSVTINLPFSHHSVDWKVRFHPMNIEHVDCNYTAAFHCLYFLLNEWFIDTYAQNLTLLTKISDTQVTVTRPWTYRFVFFCKGGYIYATAHFIIFKPLCTSP